MTVIDDTITAPVPIPAPPSVIVKLNVMMGQEMVNSYDIAGILKTDRDLTNQTLRLAGSPLFGLDGRIRSIEEAILVLGSGPFRHLLLATSAVTSLSINTSVVSMKDFWMHSFFVGLLARQLILHMGTETANEAFICGVLHDTGRLLMIRSDPERFARFADGGVSVTDLEKESQWYGQDHQQLGNILAGKWSLPETIKVSTAFHHQPEKATQFPELVAAIHIADIVCHALNLGNSANAFVSQFSPEAWELLQLQADSLEQATQRAIEEIRVSKTLITDLSRA